MVLTSSRAVPGAHCDRFSDYDVILALEDIQPFYRDRAWLEAFGRVLALYRDSLVVEGGLERAAYVTQYEDGLKIDFTLWPVALMQRVAAQPQLPEEFDAGYRVLLDKDHLTAGIKPPTYRAYIPSPPTAQEYLNAVKELFLDATYVAKFLWRRDLMAAKHMLDGILKQERLRPVLEWHYEIEHGWSVKPGLYGKGMRRWLRPDLWAALERTYAGADWEANWEALFATIDLFRRAAVEVGQRLGYAYPQELDRRAVEYLHWVRNLKSGAER